MKQLPDKHYMNLTSRQRFVGTWEAIGRGDEAERRRLEDTAPEFRYRSADHMLRYSWDAVIKISLAVEVDIRGYALTSHMAHQAGFTDISIEALKKMKKLDTAWVSLLREIGLSDVAIRATRPDPHPLVKHLFESVEKYQPEMDAGVDEYIKTAREMIPLLK